MIAKAAIAEWVTRWPKSQKTENQDSQTALTRGAESMDDFNVLEHDLVPSHLLLSEKEVAEVLQKYGIGKDQLPKIRRTDPCVRAIEDAMNKDIEEGSLIKIVRNSPVAGMIVSYRVVVKG
jgi:DNA-directed RNA polymerase subunit H